MKTHAIDRTALTVVELQPGERHELATSDAEHLVLPLSGSCVVTCEDATFQLTGRTDVFAGPTDFAYLPRDVNATIRSASGGIFALPSARCARRQPPRHATNPIPVEQRGAGPCLREVRNVCMPGTFDADSLMVCEVITPGGNWSSYPPHKHDGVEEIYYFRVAREGMAYQRVYGTTEVLAEVRTDDVVLIPHGWHGPSMAVPGYDLYYLNVMAGPERVWEIEDDPAHAWIRDTWPNHLGKDSP